MQRGCAPGNAGYATLNSHAYLPGCPMAHHSQKCPQSRYSHQAVHAHPRPHPVHTSCSYKRVDTCAAEFEANTPYMYSCYDGSCECEPTNSRKVLILGGGPNRIGQGIEFDYCCCHASFALRQVPRGSKAGSDGGEAICLLYMAGSEASGKRRNVAGREAGREAREEGRLARFEVKQQVEGGRGAPLGPGTWLDSRWSN